VIEAELHGKFRVAEDRHTSTCLGLLRLLPDSYLLEFLGRAQTLEGRLLPTASFDLIEETSFWPYLRDAGEPDAIIRLRRSDDSRRLTLIVEAKHGALKSGSEPSAEEKGGLGDEVESESVTHAPRPRDQLAKYLRAGKHEYQQVALVYLTHHRSMPRQDIEESLKAAGGDGIIYWLSWFDLHTFTVEQLESDRVSELSARRILKNLRRYLEFQGYMRFHHWSLLPEVGNLPRYCHTYGLTALSALPYASYERTYRSFFGATIRDALRPFYLGKR
jgi:hypothetical protein